jgi:predicted aspartyl protease
VDASLDGERIWVIVDTGAQVTVGNRALRARLEKHHRLGPTQPVEMLSVTGGRIVADEGVAHIIHLGDAEIHDLPIAFAEVHPFKKLGLTDRPAILLGMDALKLFDRVSVDFGKRRVRLLMPGRSEGLPETRLAHAGRAQLS